MQSIRLRHLVFHDPVRSTLAGIKCKDVGIEMSNKWALLIPALSSRADDDRIGIPVRVEFYYSTNQQSATSSSLSYSSTRFASLDVVDSDLCGLWTYKSIGPIYRISRPVIKSCSNLWIDPTPSILPFTMFVSNSSSEWMHALYSSDAFCSNDPGCGLLWSNDKRFSRSFSAPFDRSVLNNCPFTSLTFSERLSPVELSGVWQA